MSDDFDELEDIAEQTKAGVNTGTKVRTNRNSFTTTKAKTHDLRYLRQRIAQTQNSYLTKQRQKKP